MPDIILLINAKKMQELTLSNNILLEVKTFAFLRLLMQKIRKEMVIEVCVSPFGGRKGVYPHIYSLVVYVRTDTKVKSR